MSYSLVKQSHDPSSRKRNRPSRIFARSRRPLFKFDRSERKHPVRVSAIPQIKEERDSDPCAKTSTPHVESCVNSSLSPLQGRVPHQKSSNSRTPRRLKLA